MSRLLTVQEAARYLRLNPRWQVQTSVMSRHGSHELIVNRLVAGGSVFLAPTILKGRASLRVSITNFRTGEDDLRFLLDEAARVGRELASA